MGSSGAIREDLAPSGRGMSNPPVDPFGSYFSAGRPTFNLSGAWPASPLGTPNPFTDQDFTGSGAGDQGAGEYHAEGFAGMGVGGGENDLSSVEDAVMDLLQFDESNPFDEVFDEVFDDDNNFDEPFDDPPPPYEPQDSVIGASVHNLDTFQPISAALGLGTGAGNITVSFSQHTNPFNTTQSYSNTFPARGNPNFAAAPTHPAEITNTDPTKATPTKHTASTSPADTAPPVKRGRGRPKGSKNKVQRPPGGSRRQKKIRRITVSQADLELVKWRDEEELIWRECAVRYERLNNRKLSVGGLQQRHARTKTLLCERREDRVFNATYSGVWVYVEGEDKPRHQMPLVPGSKAERGVPSLRTKGQGASTAAGEVPGAEIRNESGKDEFDTAVRASLCTFIDDSEEDGEDVTMTVDSVDEDPGHTHNPSTAGKRAPLRRLAEKVPPSLIWTQGQQHIDWSGLGRTTAGEKHFNSRNRVSVEQTSQGTDLEPSRHNIEVYMVWKKIEKQNVSLRARTVEPAIPQLFSSRVEANRKAGDLFMDITTDWASQRMDVMLKRKADQESMVKYIEMCNKKAGLCDFRGNLLNDRESSVVIWVQKDELAINGDA